VEHAYAALLHVVREGEQAGDLRGAPDRLGLRDRRVELASVSGAQTPFFWTRS
jgi:hypothetical protein